ncbi:hypothetical protein P691DRAFT_618088, partial [Macrolepiota fuliginosa MF-IS2]
SQYSQAKLELFGLFHTLKDCRIWIIRVKNLVVEVDVKYIKGMINNLDIQPNTLINQWIATILLFNFQLCHIPGHSHGPDGLSHHPPSPDNPIAEDNYEEWIDQANALIIKTIHSPGNHQDLPKWL